MSMRRPVAFGDAITSAFNATSEDIGVTGPYPDSSASYGWPLPIGAKAKETDGTSPGTVTENDTAGAIADRQRRLLVSIVNPALFGTTGKWATAQSTTALMAAPGAGTSLYVTDIGFSGSANGTYIIQEMTANATTAELMRRYIGARTPDSNHFITPLRLTANRSLVITSSGGGNHSVYVAGYSAP